MHLKTRTIFDKLTLLFIDETDRFLFTVWTLMELIIKRRVPEESRSMVEFSQLNNFSSRKESILKGIRFY